MTHKLTNTFGDIPLCPYCKTYHLGRCNILRRVSLLIILLTLTGCVSPLGTDWSQRVGVSANMPDTRIPEHNSLSLELSWNH
jgi:hypothetical protein